MSLRTPLVAGVAVLGFLGAGWLYLENRELSSEVARLRAIEKHRPDPWTGADATDRVADGCVSGWHERGGFSKAGLRRGGVLGG
jgi:hypothetical protein